MGNDMKKILYIIPALLLAVSCNFLDFDESSSRYSREDMYKTYSNVQKMLTNVYGYMPNRSFSDFKREAGCDDFEFPDLDASVQRFTNGNWTPISTVDEKWEDLYKAIRSANEFLESIETVDLSMFHYDGKYERWMEHLKYYPFEARVLRAYYFFELARRYGDIPMPLKMLTAEEANSIEKTPFDEVIDFIVSECTESAANLPDTYVGMLDDEFGRVTRGFALAVKAKALLYAASPLHNPSGDREKWEKAALAAKEIIDLGVYSLDPAEKANNYASAENIMVIMRPESSSFEEDNFPLRFTEGARTDMDGYYPTQNLVDAFQTAGGYDITLAEDGWHTDDPAFDVTRPYEGRDPRFARTVLANGMAFKGATIETFVGGRDYSPTRLDLGTPTGYYLRRYIQESTSFVKENEIKNKHQWVVYRYAEALLTYAEAANEFFQSPTSTDGNLTMSALEAINLVRANASMPDVTAASYSDFQTAVRREWRVEFAFEDHRFWDVRRWKIGQSTQGRVDGVKIVKDGDDLSYSRILVRNRVWDEKMNLYPIPQSELFCNTNLNPQNTGW